MDIALELKDVEKVNNQFVESIPGNDTDLREIKEFYRQNKLVRYSFSFRLFLEITVTNTLLNLKNSSPGSDNLPFKLIQLCCPFIIKYLMHIVDLIFASDEFPSIWKISLITPIPKNNCVESLSDL